MTFEEILTQARELLRRKGRVSYRALKLQFTLDDEYVAGLKDELVEAERVAVDEDGKVLVWVGSVPRQESENRRRGEAETKDSFVFPDSPIPRFSDSPFLLRNSPFLLQRKPSRKRSRLPGGSKRSRLNSVP
jgi:hypothetical protein